MIVRAQEVIIPCIPLSMVESWQDSHDLLAIVGMLVTLESYNVFMQWVYTGNTNFLKYKL